MEFWYGSCPVTRLSRWDEKAGLHREEIAKGPSPELGDVLEPLLGEIESLKERIAEYDRRIGGFEQPSSTAEIRCLRLTPGPAFVEGREPRSIVR
jgi:hypothetical protein